MHHSLQVVNSFYLCSYRAAYSPPLCATCSGA